MAALLETPISLSPLFDQGNFIVKNDILCTRCVCDHKSTAGRKLLRAVSSVFLEKISIENVLS